MDIAIAPVSHLENTILVGQTVASGKKWQIQLDEWEVLPNEKY